jgi:hypothetical protein
MNGDLQISVVLALVLAVVLLMLYLSKPKGL